MIGQETGVDGRPSSSMETDRNLLFGVLAVQSRKITPAELVDVAGAWATDPSRDLSQRLVDAGVLSDEDRDLLSRIAQEAIRAKQGGH